MFLLRNNSLVLSLSCSSSRAKRKLSAYFGNMTSKGSETEGAQTYEQLNVYTL